jgi:PAS domain S-box-containing protein
MIQKVQQPFIAYLLVAAIFIVDTLFAYTTVDWILYLIPIIGIASFLSNKHFFIITGLCVFLTAIDHYISPYPDLTFDQIDLNNREIGIAVLLIAGFLHRLRINLSLQSESKDELQRALKLADDRASILDSLMDYLPTGVVYAEGEKPVVKMASKTFSDFVHLPLPQLQGKTVEPTRWNMRRSGCQTHITYKDLPTYRAIHSNQIIKDEEWIIGSDGKQNVYSVNSGPVKDSQGKIIGAISSWSDITERKQHESDREQLIRDLESEKQEISASEEMLKEITENVPDFLWTARPNGEFDYFSTDFLEFMEMSADETRAQWIKRTHPDDQEKVVLARDFSLKTGMNFKIEHRVLKKSENEYHWFRSTAIPIRNDSNEITHWFGVSTNIDDLKTIQLRLNRLLTERSFQKKFLKTLINSIPVGIAVVKCPEYVYEIVNPNFCSLPGQKDLHLLGKKICETVSSTEQWVNPQWLNQVCESKNTLSKHEFEAHLGGNGESSYWNFDTIPLEIANGNVDRILIIAVNITEFVAARKQKELENARYEALVNNMTDGLVIAEPNGSILHDNPEAKRLHGVDATHKPLKHAEEYPAFFEFSDLEGNLLPLNQWPLVRALNGQKFTGAEARVHRKDTGKKWFGNFSGTPVYDISGTHILSIVTIRDITESHKKAREAEEKKNILDAMMNYLPVGVMHVSVPDLMIQMTSSYDRRLSGEWVGKKLIERVGELHFYQPENDNSCDYHNYPMYRAIEKKVIVQNEIWNYGVIQGKYLNVSVSACPLFDSKGEITSAIMIWLDITEQVQARKHNEFEAARYHAIFNNIEEGLILAEPGDIMKEVNPVALKMLDFRDEDCRLPDEKYNHLLKMFNLQENELPPEQWPIPRALRGEHVDHEKIRIKNLRTGREWYSVVSGAPVYDKTDKFLFAIATFTDVSSQVSIETQLRNERNFISTILETQGALVVVLDNEGRIARFNQACEKVTGFVFEEIEGRKLWDILIRPQDIGKYKNDMKKLYSGNYPVDLENYWVSKTGEKHFIRWRCTVIKGRDDRVEVVICTGIDITDRMEAELKVQKINAELKTANNDLESFASSVSHDLRAPLNTIGGFSTILQEYYSTSLDEEGRNYLALINNGVKKMQNLIEDLLKLARILGTDIRKETVNLCDMVAETIHEITTSNPDRKTEIIVQKHVPVKADKRLLRIAVENILRNAWKFTSKNEITRIEFAAIHQNDEVVYLFRDNGAGFDMAHTDKLFVPFKRLHSEKEFSGTGVGLAIVQRIIQKHGGRIWAEGEIGKGAAFYFTLG